MARKSMVKQETDNKDALLASASKSVVAKRKAVETAKAELEMAESELLTLMQRYNVASTDDFKLASRAGAFKVTGATGVQLEQIEYALKGDLGAEFIDTKLNYAKLHTAMQYDKSISGLFRHYGVAIVQGETSYSLRTNK